jgi:hypothetical protein
MNVLTVPVRPDEDAHCRPVPWHRMAWVIWRQHRIALAGVAVFLGAVAVYVVVVGRHLHRAYAAATTCNPASATCADLITHFNFMNHVLQGGYTLQIVAPLIGAFLGAPVLARELETGTFRFAWTQGFQRWRWALAKLVGLAVVVTAAAGAVSAVFSWYYQPYFAATGHPELELSELSPFGGGVFDLRGVSFAAWTLTAFAIGALAGMVIRRVVPAIVATLAAYSGLALLVANVLRKHYLTPMLTTRVNVPGSAWILSQFWTVDGRFAFTSWRDAPQSLLRVCAGASRGPLGKPPIQSFAQCAAQHGYTQLTRYQPASRFWSFQWIEGGGLLTLSVLLIASTIWLVRRRVV